jgi:hypothetical protein
VQKIRALMNFGDFLGTFVEFTCWRRFKVGLGPICKYFLKLTGPAIIFASVQEPRRNLQQVQGPP